MLVAARQFDHLCHLSLSDFKSINAADPHSMPVNVKHDLDGFFMRLAEETFQDVDDEFHRCVVVVEDENAIERRLFGLGARFGDDTGSRAPVARIAVSAKRPSRRPSTGAAMFIA